MNSDDLKCSIPDCYNTISFSSAENIENSNLHRQKSAAANFLCFQHYNNDVVPDNELENGQLVGHSVDESERTDKHFSSDDDSSVEEIKIIIVSEEELKTCRLCLSKQSKVKNIFDDVLENRVPIFVAIVACIHPIEISKFDSYPKDICLDCLTSLSFCFEFRSACIKNDLTLKNFYTSDHITRKRKHEDEIVENSKKIRLQNELREILKDKIGEKGADAENIIFHVESDDDGDRNEENDAVAKLTRLKLPLVIKKVNNDSGQSKRVSKLGKFQCNIINYACNMKFCIIDGCLFEYVDKYNESARYFKCVVQSCFAKGIEQKILDNNTVLVNVIRLHNHGKPTKEERKKQMLFYLMKRKMQSEKLLNAEKIYQEVCKFDPEVKHLIPLKTIIKSMFSKLNSETPQVSSFDGFYYQIDDDKFNKLQFTENGVQFYQGKFSTEQGQAVVFANKEVLNEMSDSKLMYVDASFQIDTDDNFPYFLMTVLIWTDAGYYPVVFALVSAKHKDLYNKVFEFLHNDLAPSLRPDEIVCEYEANLYYALSEIYLSSNVGGSIFHYTQNLYKKVCSLNLSQDLEANHYLRNIYYMLLMLPLLPVNTISDGLTNIKSQARDLGIFTLCWELFEHVQKEWIEKVTPDFFCVHRMENRINDSIITPFKKLRDLIMLCKGKHSKRKLTIATVVQKLLELESYFLGMYTRPLFQSCGPHKKCVMRMWQYIEEHPKININFFFSRVLSYIKSMESLLWIWGFYKYEGDADEELIDATSFSFAEYKQEHQNGNDDLKESDEQFLYENDWIKNENVTQREEF